MNPPDDGSSASGSGAVDEPGIPYDVQSGDWLLDPEGLVSRNDVVYTTPSAEPWEAMPTGGGDLSAMVRWDGALHLHLTKSDAWGFREPPDAPAGSRHFNNVSPGHVRQDFGPRANAAAAIFRPDAQRRSETDPGFSP